jgi:hypothetical protein
MRLGDLLFAIILAGIGLAVAYLRAEYVLHRRFKAAEQQTLIAQRQLHANRLTIKPIHVGAPALQNHQHFLSKESAFCAPVEWPSAYLRTNRKQWWKLREAGSLHDIQQH